MQCAYGHEKQGRAVGLKICGKRGGRPLIMDLDVEAAVPSRKSFRMRVRTRASTPETDKVKAFARRGERLSNSPWRLRRKAILHSQLYGLFVTTCGAGLLTSSCALTFWI
jgi:hypothetical protein